MKRYLLLAAAVALVLSTQSIPEWGEIYATRIYPIIVPVLSSFSNIFPFSLGDVFISSSILAIVVYPVIARRKKQKWGKTILRITEYLAWVYVWFYAAWGLNYFQPNFYQRTGVKHIPYTEDSFRSFLDKYIERLNFSFSEGGIPTEKESSNEEIILQYHTRAQEIGIYSSVKSPRAKTMLFSPLFSKMAVTGYMGPFFCEFNVNKDLLPYQYPHTYAHELAHLLGISSEAEANFYAYYMCTHSSNPTIAFCGYFSVLSHVLSNARRLMEEDEYKQVYESIQPEIIALAKESHKYWADKYSPIIGDIQDWIYNLYLKGNQIPSGTKNYSEVIGLLISWENAEEKKF